MSYKITAWFTDEYIDQTVITVGAEHITRLYGDEKVEIAECEGDSVFEADATEGYEFYRWVYRLGSTTASVRYSTSNPFTYSGDQDIYIRAEAKELVIVEEWTLKTYTVGSITSTTQRSFNLPEMQLRRYRVQFAYAGVARFYTTGNNDTIGYLTTTTKWDKEYGVPNSVIIKDDDGGDKRNFSISYSVAAGTVYYIWVKEYDGQEASGINLFIVPPESGTGAYIYNGSSWIQATPYIHDGSKWVEYIPQIYSNGWK